MGDLSPISCWVISDGRRGIENQALAIAQALSELRPLKTAAYIISGGSFFKPLPPLAQKSLKSKPENFGLSGPYPKIAIGSGRQAIAPLIALKKKLGPEIFTIYVQDPRINPKCFDYVIAPQHDELTGENVLSIIGSPNMVTQKRLIESVEPFSKKLNALPAPRVAVLIGGTSKTHQLSKECHNNHKQAILALLEQNISVMITTSRRTPDWAQQDYKELAKRHSNIWYWDGDGSGAGENPYFAFLGAADALLVTKESTNMLCEACATGKPVFTLEMQGNSGKFTQLYSALESRCAVLPYAGSITGKSYPPLDETRHAAIKLLGKLGFG